MSKPIEPGCWAISTGHVHHANNRYKSVRVLYNATSEHDDPPDVVWCVEGDVYSRHFGHGKADFLDRDLLRIDGGDAESAERVAERQEVEA